MNLKNIFSYIGYCLALALVGWLSPALAQDPTSAGSLGDIEIHAFASQGFIYSTDNNFLTDSSSGSFEFSEVGINFTKVLQKNLRVGLQLFSRDLGNIGDYTAKLDWYYLSYEWSELLGIRVGRIKLPFGLYNDSSDIDSARVPILLPQSVYPTTNRDFLLAQTGMEIFGRADLGDSGALDYRLYGGTIFVDFENNPASATQVSDLTTPYIIGSRLLWETPVEGLHVAASVQALELDLDATVSSAPVEIQVPAVLWVASAEYTAYKWSFAAEYSRWDVELESSDTSVAPETQATSERAYIMSAYRFSPKYQAGLYYSILFPNVDDRAGREDRHYDLAATWRFDLNENWLVKLEAHYIQGTAGLDSTLNDGRALSSLTEDWGLFLIKTTAYF